MNRGIITVIIFALFLITAMYIGDVFLSRILKMPIDKVPAAAKIVVHGITLGLLFAVVKKFFAK